MLDKPVGDLYNCSMSNHTNPNSRTAAQNVRSILTQRYGFKRSDFHAMTTSNRNVAWVHSTKVDERVLASCLRSSGLQVEHGEVYGLVVSA